MYDALSRMYEGRNINRKMNLRAQLKSIKMSHGESIQNYFTRVSQIKEQLEAIGDNLDEDEMVMTALNGITRPWESFIQMMCARKESMEFDVVWEDCIQEETIVANRESLLKEDEGINPSSRREITRSINLPKDSKDQEKVWQIRTTLVFTVSIVTR